MLATSGFEDVLYAVPLGLDKVEPVCAIAAKLPGLQVLIDSHAALDALLAALEQTTTVPLPMGMWLKVDCGYHRAGLEPHDAALLGLAQRIHESQFVRLAGKLAGWWGCQSFTPLPSQTRASMSIGCGHGG